MLEMHGGNGKIASNQQMRKELTQIRKAARVLRDPGTTSTWQLPLSSGRSLAVVANEALPLIRYNHCYDNYRSNSNGIGNEFVYDGNKVSLGDENDGRGSGKGKDRRVFLCNWRSKKSGSEKSLQSLGQIVTYEKGDVDDGGDMSLEGSVDNSVSDSRNGGGDLKTDTFFADRYAALVFGCKDTKLTPSVRRNTMKRKVIRSAQSAALWEYHLQQQIVPCKTGKEEDSESCVDQSDDTGYFNSEDLRRYSAESPFLAPLKSSKTLRSSVKDVSSYAFSTPAMSGCSLNQYSVRNPSTAESWNPTTESCNDEMDDSLDFQGSRGCGLPCYWSRRSTPRYRGARGSSCSPSLSDILRRKGSNLLCGSQAMYHERCYLAPLNSKQKKLGSKMSQSLVPLLTSTGDRRVGSSLETWMTDDDISTNYGEIDLDGSIRLDGRRGSTTYGSRDGLELVACNKEREYENVRSLSHRYRPVFFSELVGQNVVIQSLTNAILKRRVAPLYLFQGPRGTGKSSAARIFANALNCLANVKSKPCGVCRECTDFISEKSKDLTEVDGSNKKEIVKVRCILKRLSASPLVTFSQYKVFIIEECHLLPAKTWLAFLKFLEEPPPLVLFIFITTDLENVPRTVLSRCQKFIFNKIRDCDIVSRLEKISVDENLDVESDALDLVALNADGSLRDAETMLEQLTLLGKRITTALVNELVGVVSDEKLLELLELAMSSETVETVKRARELMDSGVDPMLLMSQLATLIVDIIAGTYHIVDSKYEDSFFSGRSLNDAEMDRLKHALKLLSEADKQLRTSSEQSTWFTATLLQLGSVPSPDPSLSGSSRRQSSKTIVEVPSSTTREVFHQNFSPNGYALRKSTTPRSFFKSSQRDSTSQEEQLIGLDSNATRTQYIDSPLNVSHNDSVVETTNSSSANSGILNDLWMQCIEKCHPSTLRQLLHTYGKLVSISEVEGDLVANIAFQNRAIKIRAERSLSSIANSFKTILQHDMVVKIILWTDGENAINSEKHAMSPEPMVQKQMYQTEVINGEKRVVCTNELYGYSDHDSYQQLPVSRVSLNDSEHKPVRNSELSAELPTWMVEENNRSSSKKERKLVAPVRRIESIIHEQRLETAWLQIAEKSTPGSLSRWKPERNQVLPQEGIYIKNKTESVDSKSLTSQHWEDELNAELNALKVNGGKVLIRDQIGKRVGRYPMSPSLLQNNFSRESTGYESSTGAGGCSGLLCWMNHKNRKTRKNKQRTPVSSQKSSCFLWLGECAKMRRTQDRFRS
ncbi:protein STICHEL-like [Apium graveolens]|uniref:protein STICHEL-like n=1 Tax=Apium graveolens TaxID=4045 RepID=UPI003D7BBEEA